MAKRAKKSKTVLRLPDLDYSKSAVLNSLPSLNSRRSYEHAISDFIEWYCSEPRLAFNKTVVTRYRIALEQRRYSPSTINLRLAAVRRLAYEASDCGLLSPDLAAGIRRVKGVKRIGVRLGNWLSAEQSKRLIAAPSGQRLQDVRNRAVLAMLVGCGLRRAEIVTVKIEDFELREEHWILADLIGKGGHMRTVPVPTWVKATVDAWIACAELRNGTLFRAIGKTGKVYGGGWVHSESNLVYCPQDSHGLRSWQDRSPRSTANLRPPLSSSRRRTGADPVPTRACFCADDGTLSWLQTTASECR